MIPGNILKRLIKNARSRMPTAHAIFSNCSKLVRRRDRKDDVPLSLMEWDIAREDDVCQVGALEVKISLCPVAALAHSIIASVKLP